MSVAGSNENLVTQSARRGVDSIDKNIAEIDIGRSCHT